MGPNQTTQEVILVVLVLKGICTQFYLWYILYIPYCEMPVTANHLVQPRIYFGYVCGLFCVLKRHVVVGFPRPNCCKKSIMRNEEYVLNSIVYHYCIQDNCVYLES
jgi:hypothetical protein